MNAPNPLSSDQRADRKGLEPSMEEILASIRRIIADDQAFARQAPIAEVVEAQPSVETGAPEPVEKPQIEKAQIERSQIENPLRRARLFAKAEPPKPVVAFELPKQKLESPEHEPELVDVGEKKVAAPGLAPVATAGIAPFPVEAKFHFFKSAAASHRIEPAPPELEQPEPEFESALAQVIGAALPPADPSLQAETSGRDAFGAERSKAIDGIDSGELEPDLREAAAANFSHPARASGPVQELPLVSPETDAAVSSAFSALAASRLLPSNEDLKEMVREMMRPMLKAWLDDNLPILVERLVRAEIERVARGGR